jgi:hypothetical protein
MNKQDKNNMRTPRQKPIIDAEAFMKFFEETAGVKLVDAETGQPALDILAKQKGEKKSDYDLWLEQQDEEIKKAHKMGEL